MTETSSTKRDNNFGALRLLFAIFVVVAHSAILIDGNNTREMLTRLCGTTSLGPVGVDGFFLVSGYLITQSFVSRDGIATYLRKRVLRIVPGYAACFLLCVFVLAPLVGGTLTLPLAGDQIARMSFLMWPAVPDVFPGLHYRTLDGSMWTIGYEARCYLATALLGSIGLFEPRARLVLVPAVMALLALHATGLLKDTTIAHEEIFGEIGKSVRLFGVYGAGALFFLFRERIPLTGRGAFVATLLLVPSLFSAVLSEAAVAVFGGYILFWFALKVRVPRLRLFEGGPDISYGVYLYAWPIQSVLIYAYPGIDPLGLSVMALPLSLAAGYASWVLVERPFLQPNEARFTKRANSSRAAPAPVS